jgi:hypothetical protein
MPEYSHINFEKLFLNDINKYESPLAKGNFGQVYLATWQTSLQVVLKTLQTTDVEALLNEAMTLLYVMITS